MKNILSIFIVLFISLTFSIITKGQVTETLLNSQVIKSDFTVQRDIKLNNSIETKEVEIIVITDNANLNLKISSIITSGEVSIDIYDPTDKKEGSFSVGTQVNSANANERVRGQIQKQFESPIKGKWKVKIKTNKATGDINIWYRQYNNEKADN